MNRERVIITHVKQQLDALATSVARLADEVETASHRSRWALRRYPRVRSLLKRFLLEAASAQSEAMRSARQITKRRDEAVRLRAWIDRAEFLGADADEIARLRRQIRTVEAQIETWGTDPGS